jgi:RimJ/RimL family protein N-acetyltransferase
MLRQWSESELDEVVAAVADPAIRRWSHLPEPFDRAAVHRWFEAMARERAEGSAIRLAIADAETDQLLGAAALKRFDWTVPTAELGYWVSARARGRGVGGRAVRLLVQWGFAETGVSEITARTDLDNYASQRLLERQGFSQVPLQPVGDPPLVTYAIRGTDLAT